MDDTLPTAYGPVERVIYSGDRRWRILIVRRTDGLFNLWEEWVSEDDEVFYWSRPMHPLRGIYDSADNAQAEVKTWPRYRDPN